MKRLRRGVELGEHELADLERGLTVEQRYALIDSGWGDDLRAAFDFAMRHLPELREEWAARQERVSRGLEAGWQQFVVLRFLDQAVPLLVANRLDPPNGAPSVRTADTAPASRSRRPREAKRETYGHPATKYKSKPVADAVRRWREGGETRNVSEISRRTGLSRPLVLRIGRLDGHGAFELGSRGGLRVLGMDGRFRAAGASVSIRALERAFGLPALA